MAYSVPVQNTTLVAGENLINCQYRSVRLLMASSQDGVAILNVDGTYGIGILQNTPTLGQIANVMIIGESRAVFGSSVNAGDKLTADSEGRFIPLTTDEFPIAIAKESGNENEIHTVILYGAGIDYLGDLAMTRSIWTVPVYFNTLSNGVIINGLTSRISSAVTIRGFALNIINSGTANGGIANFRLKIGSNDVSGGIITLNDENVVNQGAIINSTEITNNNIFYYNQIIYVLYTLTGTFIDGQGLLMIKVGY